jgi:hypothetical protein
MSKTYAGGGVEICIMLFPQALEIRERVTAAARTTPPFAKLKNAVEKLA